MTNMPEAKLAREAELCYATLALVTDYDVWHESHDGGDGGGGGRQPAARTWRPPRTCSAASSRAVGEACARRLRRRAGQRGDHQPQACSRRAPASGSTCCSTATSRRRARRAVADRAEPRRRRHRQRAGGRAEPRGATRSSPRQGLIKGTMHLVDEPRARELYDAMGPGVEMSGGSAANTVVGVASFGGRAHYVGKVRDDQLGEVFGHDLRATGVGYDTPRATDGPAHRALPDPGDARRPAHHEHVPRRLGAARSRRHRPRAHRPRPDPLPRGLSLRSARGPGGLPHGRGHRPRRRPQGLADPVGPVLRGPASRRPSSTWSSTTWTSSSPTRRRSARCTR